MAIEEKRGCGYRQVGGLYLVCPPIGFHCDRLPLPLHVCPVCGGGIKFSRGFTWIEPIKLFGRHETKIIADPDMSGVFNRWNSNTCECDITCPVCVPSFAFDESEGRQGRAGLLWIGEKHYSPESFSAEAAQLGISKRISAIPRGFIVGKTWIFLAFKKYPKPQKFGEDPEYMPAVIMAFRPARIERIVLASEFESYLKIKKDLEDSAPGSFPPFNSQWGQIGNVGPVLEMIKDDNDREIFLRLFSDEKRGITLIPVPDNDPDHNRAAPDARDLS